MNYPAELKYSKSHEWIKMEGDVAVIGISDFAQDALGDVVFINLPEEGDSVAAGEAFGDGVRQGSFRPDQPGLRRRLRRQRGAAGRPPSCSMRTPYGAWIIKVDQLDSQEELLDAAAYEAFCAQEG